MIFFPTIFQISKLYSSTNWETSIFRGPLWQLSRNSQIWITPPSIRNTQIRNISHFRESVFTIPVYFNIFLITSCCQPLVYKVHDFINIKCQSILTASQIILTHITTAEPMVGSRQCHTIKSCKDSRTRELRYTNNEEMDHLSRAGHWHRGKQGKR